MYMYISIYMCVCIYTYIHMYIHIYICICILTDICVYIYNSVSANSCRYIYTITGTPIPAVY